MNKVSHDDESSMRAARAATSTDHQAKRERLAHARALITAQFGASILMYPESTGATRTRRKPR